MNQRIYFLSLLALCLTMNLELFAQELTRKEARALALLLAQDALPLARPNELNYIADQTLMNLIDEQPSRIPKETVEQFATHSLRLHKIRKQTEDKMRNVLKQSNYSHYKTNKGQDYPAKKIVTIVEQHLAANFDLFSAQDKNITDTVNELTLQETLNFIAKKKVKCLVHDAFVTQQRYVYNRQLIKEITHQIANELVKEYLRDPKPIQFLQFCDICTPQKISEKMEELQSNETIEYTWFGYFTSWYTTAKNVVTGWFLSADEKKIRNFLTQDEIKLLKNPKKHSSPTIIIPINTRREYLPEDDSADSSVDSMNSSVVANQNDTTSAERATIATNQQLIRQEKITRAQKKRDRNYCDLADEEKRIIELPEKFQHSALHLRSLRQGNTWECGIWALFNAQFIEKILNNSLYSSLPLHKVVQKTNSWNIEYTQNAFVESYNQNFTPLLYGNRVLIEDPCSGLLCPSDPLNDDQSNNSLEPAQLEIIAQNLNFDERLFILSYQNKELFDITLRNQEYIEINNLWDDAAAGTLETLRDIKAQFEVQRAKGDDVKPLHFLCLLNASENSVGHYVLISVIQHPTQREKNMLIYMDSANTPVFYETSDSCRYLEYLHNIFIDTI